MFCFYLFADDLVFSQHFTSIQALSTKALSTWKTKVRINLRRDKTPGENEHFIFRFRVFMLSKILRYWTGPMSLAIYVKMSELDELVNTIRTDIPLVLKRKNIDIHFVIQSGVSISVYKTFKREVLSIILASHTIIGV